MKNHKSLSLLYSLFLHGVIVILVIILVVTLQDEKKILQEHCYVVQLSQFDVKPTPKLVVKKQTIKKKVKPPVKKKVIKKKPVKKKVVKRKPVVKKIVPVKKAPVVEPEVNEAEIVEEVEEPKAVVITPNEEAVLSPAAQEKVEEPLTPESTPEEMYVQTHISEIMSLLRKNLYYPRMARKRHIQGKVMVRFELRTNGEIHNITIMEAGRDILGAAAVTTIERLEGKFPLPDETLILHVPIMYQLK